MPQEPIKAARFGVLQRKIIQKADISQMPAHRPDHSQRQFGSLAQQGHKFCFRNKNDRARNKGAAAGGITLA